MGPSRKFFALALKYFSTFFPTGKWISRWVCNRPAKSRLHCRLRGQRRDPAGFEANYEESWLEGFGKTNAQLVLR